MGTTHVSARWTGDALTFVGTDSKNHEITMGRGNVPPTQMMLLGLAGCMGMDIVSILQKKRQNLTGVEVQVTGYNADEYPKPYETVELSFLVKGQRIDRRAVERAIELSMTKYCIVGQTLQKQVQLKTSFEIEEAT